MALATSVALLPHVPETPLGLRNLQLERDAGAVYRSIRSHELHREKNYNKCIHFAALHAVV